MSFTSQQYSDALAHENMHQPTSSQVSTLVAIASTSAGDAAAIKILATETNAPNGASGYLDQVPEQVLQIIQEATGHVPNYTQISTWTNYINGGGSLASMASAFVASDMFANLYNNGVNVDPSSAIAANVIQGVINASHAGWNSDGTASQAQVDHWVSTGLPTDQVFSLFAVGDQYTTFVQPHAIDYFEDVAYNFIVGTPAYPSGDLLSL